MYLNLDDICTISNLSIKKYKKKIKKEIFKNKNKK